MKYLFVLGRNAILSKAEVFSYFEKEENKILNSEENGNGLLVELTHPLPLNSIRFFGGVVAIGEVISEVNIKELEKDLDKINLYSGTENKLNYALWSFSENFDEFQDYLKARFKKEKLKATLKHLTRNVDLQSGGKLEIPSSKLIDEEFFIFDGKGKTFFGKITQNPDYSKMEERDMEKPVRRESLAISPRLSKILINLSKVKKDETLIDPFCGIGVLLSEALLLGIKVIGIDKDKDAINGAKQNLEWFKFKKENYKLLNSDSTKVGGEKGSAIATEPDLGKTLKKMPTKNEAKKTLESFENLIIGVINNFKGNISGRIVFSSPYIRIGKERLKCNIEKILEKTGYELKYEIPEYRENQFVGRVIYVLEKRVKK
ncbi:MAG: methyltransferase domain-containing protein [archaeon]|nr:methyltransferase domain-containing protein [archaeon]